MNEKKSGGTSKQTLQTLQTRTIEIPTKISLAPVLLNNHQKRVSRLAHPARSPTSVLVESAWDELPVNNC
ncbi:MAG: hypothetical protein F6K58_20815 [Symploca sp. SIO2E9]|nr:hypothetical protein [Symploca sp. SIO2E9]